MSDDPVLAPRLAAQGLRSTWRPLTGDRSDPLRAAGQALILLDLRTHPERGLSLLEGLHFRHPDLPLLALLPRGCAELPLRAAAAGADDFCLGGDDTLELAARVRRLLQPRPVPDALVVGDLALEPATGRVRRAGRLLDLPPRQRDLLVLLMRHAGEVMSRERIEAELALVPGERRSNLVEVHIHHLRRHLGPGRLLTLRGQGYRLLAEALVADATERTLRE